MADFLLEIGLEEVPARMLARAQVELGERVLELLRRERLLAAEAAVETYSTPRRLAVLVRGVEVKQPDVEEQLTGPAWAIAFKDGAPTPAAHAFAKKASVSIEQLKPVATAKGEYATVTMAKQGRAAAELLADLLPKEIAALSWPKAMYWRMGKPERFVRPLQWLVALLDEAVVPLEFAGIRAGRLSYGHRVLHGAEPVAIFAPANYVDALLAAWVMIDVEARRHTIRKALDRVTRTAPGARWREDEALVDTVTHLTEWPSVVLGHFAPDYLKLPEEVLVTVMRDHQKYFAVEDAEGKLLPHFLTVLNTATDEQGKAVIRHGNERVLRARFNDAQFFWDFDQKIALGERVALLEEVTFHKDLGSYRQKIQRTWQIASALEAVASQRGASVDRDVLRRAVELAKVDLTTELVKEFTELQGIVGGLYVRHQAGRGDGNKEAVAQAVYSQYMPASINDDIPSTTEGQLLGLSDRIGTIVDMFAIGLAPSGSKDPYALRRAANAVIKILAVSRLPLRISDLLAAANSPGNVSVKAFLTERLSFYAREVEKLSADVVAAVLAANPFYETGADDVLNLLSRGNALATVRGSEDMAAISVAWKRTKNILEKARERGDNWTFVEPQLLSDEAEIALWKLSTNLAPEIEELRKRGEYLLALGLIAQLRPALDHFFDTVMVMTDDPPLRVNRLALLQAIYFELGRIADFSELSSLAPEGAE